MQAEIDALTQQINQLKRRLRVVKAEMQKVEADMDTYSYEEYVQKAHALIDQEKELDIAIFKSQNRLWDLTYPQNHLFGVRVGGFTAYFGNIGNTRTQLL